ncbi:hypothetical protein [Sphaerisporangium rubeum]|uniref:hypothetical protein n=1 Tax=Sphaerisporangium rubeum TaxID=321317 RepID=UPI001616AFA7|nr:hypothetical protein [Sphaerisporangium rubeum]
MPLSFLISQGFDLLGLSQVDGAWGDPILYIGHLWIEMMRDPNFHSRAGALPV